MSWIIRGCRWVLITLVAKLVESRKSGKSLFHIIYFIWTLKETNLPFLDALQKASLNLYVAHIYTHLSWVSFIKGGYNKNMDFTSMAYSCNLIRLEHLYFQSIYVCHYRYMPIHFYFLPLNETQKTKANDTKLTQKVLSLNHERSIYPFGHFFHLHGSI